MRTTITIEHDYYDIDGDLCGSRVELEVGHNGLLILTVRCSEAFLSKKKVLETAQALNYLATTMEDEE